jgi:solute carrier family 25, member 39/40
MAARSAAAAETTPLFRAVAASDGGMRVAAAVAEGVVGDARIASPPPRALPSAAPPVVPPEDHATPLQRLVSATAGALITTLATTPLEVVKTRMQTVLPPAREAAARAGAAAAFPAGAAAAGNGFGAAAPLARPPALSPFRMAALVIRTEGLRSLWSGLAPSLAMQIPSTTLYFAAYDELKARTDRAGRERRARGAWGSESIMSAAPLVAGVAARVAAVTVVAPLELLRTNAM